MMEKGLSYKKNILIRTMLGMIMGAGLVGCVTTGTPENRVMTARPVAPVVSSSGASLYSAQTFQPLFEDKRARHVGDVLTITITENNTASKKSSDDASRKSNITGNVGNITGLPLKSLQGLSVNGGSSYTFNGSGDAAMTNAFTGTIAVTVIEELSNGHLVVAGEKKIAINHGTEYVRLSGVVNPMFLVGNNIASNKVADAKLEFKQDGALDQAQTQGWLSRFFLSILPF